MNITIASFIAQINEQFINSDDVIESIGTWTGNDKYLYTLHCRQENGEKYDIDICLIKEG